MLRKFWTSAFCGGQGAGRKKLSIVAAAFVMPGTAESGALNLIPGCRQFEAATLRTRGFVISLSQMFTDRLSRTNHVICAAVSPST